MWKSFSFFGKINIVSLIENFFRALRFVTSQESGVRSSGNECKTQSYDVNSFCDIKNALIARNRAKKRLARHGQHQFVDIRTRERKEVSKFALLARHPKVKQKKEFERRKINFCANFNGLGEVSDKELCFQSNKFFVVLLIF